MKLDLLRGLRIPTRGPKSAPRRRGNHRRSPRIEALEIRELLALSPGAMQIGSSTETLSSWGTAIVFKNVMMESNDAWSVAQASNPSQDVSGVQGPATDPNGYPIGLGDLPSHGYVLATSTLSFSGAHYPSGVYTLTFDGDGTVEIFDYGMVPQYFTQSGGTGSPFNVYVNAPQAEGFFVAITASNPSDYVRNIRLVMPGYQDNYVSQPFYPAFLDEFGSMQQIRTTSLMQIISATQNVGETWSEETPATYFTQATPYGVNVEYLVDLANTLQENLWVSMPVGADNAFYTNFSGYVAQNLDSNLKVYVEYGNETWNSTFSNEYNYVNNYGIANGVNIDQATAILATQMWDVWLQSFAGQTGRVLRVASSQFSVPYHINQEIAELAKIASPSDPDHGFDLISAAPYFGPNTSAYNAQTTVQEIEQDSMAALAGLQTQIQNFMSVVNSWSATLDQKIPVIAYESGLDITAPQGASWWNAYLAAETDPGMYSVLLTYFQDLQAGGFAGFNYCTLAYQVDQYGEWGLMDYIGEPPSLTPKYDALIDFIDSQGTSLDVDDSATAPTAGQANSFTVTAYNANGTVDTGYTGTVTFSSTDPYASLPASYTFTAQDDGVHTFSATFDTAGPQMLAATDSADALFGMQWGIAVSPAAAASFLPYSYLSPATAGTAQEIGVMAFDAYGNGATGYTGTVQFSSSDPQAGLPADITFTSGDDGYIATYVLLDTAGVQSITVTDTSNSSITGTESGITVLPAAASTFSVSGFPSPTTAGVAQTFTVAARDPYGNIATGYVGTVEFSSSDPEANLPSNYTFTTADQGTYTFSATFKTAGTQSISAKDTANSAIAGTEPGIRVHPAAAASLAITKFSTTVNAGSANTLLVTAYDQYGNVATGYTGTVAFASSDPKATLPANFTFSSSNQGAYYFYTTQLRTAGTQWLSVTDTGNSSLTFKQSGITVEPLGFYSLGLAGFPNPVTAGVASSVTVTAYDVYGNVATSYTGTVSFYSSDGQAGLPANYTFTAGDAGVHTFSATLKTVGTQSITAYDTHTYSYATKSGIAVQPATAVAAMLTLTGFPRPATAGAASNFTVTAYDQFGNVATGYTGTVAFSSSDPQAALPADYTFTPANQGTYTFSATLKTAGAQSISVTDTANSAVAGTQSGIAVLPAAASKLTVTGFPSPATAGAASNFTLTLYDPYGNIATGYTGTVAFSSSDPQAALPADYTFAPANQGTYTFSATLKTAGAQSISAADTANSAVAGTQSGIAVLPAAASKLTVTGFPSPATAGAASNFTLTLYDPYGNIATGYTGTVAFSSSDPQAALPADYTFAPANQGTYTFSATLKTAGAQSISAADTANSAVAGTQSGIAVLPAAASKLTVTGFPSPATAGAASNFTVTAYDQFGNVATGYTGTVAFSSSDPQATLPADYTFTPANQGTYTFSATLKTAGAQSISVTDTANSAVAGTQSGIAVLPAAAAALTLAGFPSPTKAGVTARFVVTAYDPYGNVATAYSGTVKFSSSDTRASLPANYTFTSRDMGTHFFSATLETVGTQSITAADTSNSAITGTESGIVVQPNSSGRQPIGSRPSTFNRNTVRDSAVTAADQNSTVDSNDIGTLQPPDSDTVAGIGLPNGLPDRRRSSLTIR